ncbi:MCE family protein [Gordonia sp. CPCC 205333]|uniref:MCE family protein n=1 Tax=Gordonia sp. CPCC 205333 TaxID=3140790 RepID=UPI003AF3AE0B
MSVPFGGVFKNRRSTSGDADAARDDKRGVRSRAAAGVIGFVVTAMVVVVALQMDKLPYLSPISTYSAYFDDAGGLVPGDVVVVSGVNVGSVEKISLASTDKGTKARVNFRTADNVLFGIDTQAAIKTETVLGRRNLTLISHGPDRIKPGGEIPNENTVSPYSLSDALEGATDTLSETNVDQLNEALRTMTNAFSQTPSSVRGAVDGVSRVSKAIADRDNSLRELLAKANRVSKILGDRSEKINDLLLDANSLFGELQMRQQAIGLLITGTRDVAAQISGFIKDNNAQLKPVLLKLNRVLNVLNDNQKVLGEAIDQLGPYANTLGEAVASGPYFSSLVGIPTFGDYTAVFMKILRQKYPEIWQAYSYTNILNPENYSLVPGYDENKPKPKPTVPYPTAGPPQTTKPRTSYPPLTTTTKPRAGG